MADEESLPPIEIPWRLASTTQPVTAGDPEETAISLFTYAPDDAVLTAAFPDERLFYLKVTTSIGPADVPANLPPLAGAALGEGVPAYHVRLDLKIRPGGGAQGSIRPYFHSAAPMRRRWIQTGVVGGETFEGEADGQFMGKSGSQMYESANTYSRTTSFGANAGLSVGPVSIGGSASRTTTDVESERAAAQTIDTTTREASQERRELVSHHTQVENVLTLLSGRYAGTPYLRFSLSPQPLALLSLDPADPNLQYSQLLARRSSGLEGMQEFTAVVLVPRDSDFCVEARMERVCVLDAPPGPLTFDEPFTFTGDRIARMMDYFDRVYPPGTPLDELDVDIVGDLPNPDDFERGVVHNFAFGPLFVFADIEAPRADALGVRQASVPYKHNFEVWLDTLRDEYEHEAARSPLERGVVVADERTLDTCFSTAAGGEPVVTSSSAQLVPLHQLAIAHHELDIGGVNSNASTVSASARERAIEAVTRGNLLEERLRVLLERRRPGKAVKRLRFDDDRLLDVLLRIWSGLRDGDERNVPVGDVVRALGLDDLAQRLVKQTGASDLRGVARAILGATRVDRYNAMLSARRGGDDGSRVTVEPLPVSLPAPAAVELRRAIAAALEKGLGEP